MKVRRAMCTRAGCTWRYDQVLPPASTWSDAVYAIYVIDLVIDQQAESHRHTHTGPVEVEIRTVFTG
jgi:hypothetical protein